MQFFPSRTVALSIGALQIHWYGIMYLLGFLIGAWLLPRLMKFRGLDLSRSDQESLILHVFLGVLLGGRFGFVLFYGGDYYLQHPLEIFAVWQGGMSSHGGFIGVILMLLLFCHRKKISVLSLADIIVIPVAIGLALGRIGNLINGELYGTVTNVRWAMAFPGAIGLRHPTQIYAFFKDLLITAVCLLHLSTTSSFAMQPKKTWNNCGNISHHVCSLAFYSRNLS
jgi:phosphatidylglycerol:prolipoprotein diacylglycerol transferase